MTIRTNDRVELVNALGFKKLKVGDKGTVIEIVPSRIGQGAEARIKWDTPPRSFTSSVFLTRLRKIVVPATVSVGDTVHLNANANFPSYGMGTTGTVVSMQLKARSARGGEMDYLARVRLANGKHIKAWQSNLTRGAYIAPRPVAAPAARTPVVAAGNVVNFDRAAVDAAIRAARPGDTVVVVIPRAA